MKLKKIIKYTLLILLFLLFSTILFYGSIPFKFNSKWLSLQIKPDWLTWDLILILTTSTLILVAYLCELFNSRLFNKIRIAFFISMSITTIVAVLFQIHHSYKRDLIITDFKIHIILLIKADWKIDNFDNGTRITDLNEYVYNFASLKLKKNSSNQSEEMIFYSHFFNTLFEPVTSHIEKKDVVYGTKFVALKLEDLPFFPLYDKNIDIFKTFHKFKVEIRNQRFSHFKKDRIQLVQAQMKIYMNGSVRSAFTISDSKFLSADYFGKNNTLFLSFDIKEKYGDVFYLLRNKIKQKLTTLD